MTSRHASSPVFFAAPGRPSLQPSAFALKGLGATSRTTSKRAEGARDARVLGALKFTQCAQTKVLGPTDLDASQHRGALKSEPQVRRFPGVPRAMFIGLLRLAPGGLPISGNPPLLANWKAAYPPLWAQVGRGIPVTGCHSRHHGARRRAAGAPGRG